MYRKDVFPEVKWYNFGDRKKITTEDDGTVKEENSARNNYYCVSMTDLE